MTQPPPDYFGPDVAPSYDADVAEHFSDDELGPTVDLLADLAGAGGGDQPAPVLELAIGTGRVALPLRARGLDVAGIDLSAAMVEQLRRKPGGDAVPVVIGDMTTEVMADRLGRCGLVYLVFNTVMNLTSQAAQVACFINAARHLRPGGVFVVETMMPRLQCLPPGQRVHPFSVTDEHLGFDEYDVATQDLVSHHYTFGVGGAVTATATPFRYVWPAELDLMARLAGLSLENRWGGWRRTPFTADSGRHVSVWGKPAS